MPLYEYECQDCGARTEELQRFDDPPLTTCPACGGRLSKLVSAPAFQFKGSGWYITDYAGKKGADSAKESGGESASKVSSESSSEKGSSTDSGSAKKDASGSPSKAKAST